MHVPGITLPLAMIQYAAPPVYSSRVALGESAYANGMWVGTRENAPEAPPPTGTSPLASDDIVSHCTSRLVIIMTLVVRQSPRDRDAFNVPVLGNAEPPPPTLSLALL